MTRVTVDVDVVTDLAAEPASAAVRALTELGLMPRLAVDALSFADADVFAEHPLDFEELVGVCSGAGAGRRWAPARPRPPPA